MPRLGFTKSRNGCRKCRQRRVKCDEQRPCGACRRHGLVCSLVEDLSAASDLSQPSSVTSTGNSVTREPLAALLTAGPALFNGHSPDFAKVLVDPPPDLTPPPGASEEPSQDLQSRDWVTDVELMHHYSTNAYRTMPRVDEVGHIWQVEAVQLSISYRYVLHLVLAYSAFHLASLRPDQQRRCYYAAAQHQSLGIQGVRAALGSLNEENCHALFMAGSFLAIGKFAALANYVGDTNESRPNLEDLIELFILLKGMDSVLQSWEPVIKQGPFGRLITVSDAYHRPSTALLDDIGGRLEPLGKVLAAKPFEDLAIAATIDGELAEFARSLQHAINFSPDPELRFVMLWPIYVSDGYIKILRREDPAAMVLLSYYLVVVHATETKTWYTRGWGLKLLRAMETKLPPGWDGIMKWQLERVTAFTA